MADVGDDLDLDVIVDHRTSRLGDFHTNTPVVRSVQVERWLCGYGLCGGLDVFERRVFVSVAERCAGIQNRGKQQTS